MNDYEAHLSSYDHSHKQRLKDMKAMVRDPNAGARARRAEAKADGIVSIKIPQNDPSSQQLAGGTSGGGGFKKGGFKKSGFKSAFAPVDAPSATASATPAKTSENDTRRAPLDASTAPLAALAAERQDLVESDTDDEGYEYYDPRYPTD